METAWERHGICEFAFRVSLPSLTGYYFARQFKAYGSSEYMERKVTDFVYGFDRQLICCTFNLRFLSFSSLWYFDFVPRVNLGLSFNQNLSLYINLFIVGF
jgi:hypothetical protein